jgi:membrane-associated HD superfamily phosphohydrolase
MNWIKSIVKFWKTIQIVLIYLVSILLVYFMFPREGKFRYEYSKNTPWMHENLVAPFDFPIYKPDQQVQRERDSLLNHSHLYFNHDTIISNSILNSFNSDYSAMAASLGIGAKINDSWTLTGHVLSNMLEEIYNTGIIERHPILDGLSAEESSVMVVKDGLAEEHRLATFFTGPSAYQHILRNLEGIHPGSLAILNRMNLNDYLRPNALYDEDMTQKVREAAADQLVLTQGMVQSGQLIISRGELVSGNDFRIIESLRREYESNPNVGKNYGVVYIGQLLLIVLVFLALLWFITIFRRTRSTNGDKPCSHWV